MKKLLAGILSVAMLGCFALAGCGTTTTTPAEGGAEDGAGTGPYHIGICQLMEHPSLDMATQGFEDALIELLGEENVTFDLQNAQGDSQTCATIANQFVSGDCDLILANATAALQACSTATDTIPIVATSITSFPAALDIEPDENGVLGINVTGTNDLAPMDELAAMTMELFPDANQVGILFCSAEVNSQYQADAMAEYLTAGGFNCKNYTYADSNDMQAVVMTAATECDVLYVPTDNVAAANTGILSSILLPAGIPLICGEESTCADAGLATLTLNFYDLGHRAGEMAYDILVNGADPAAMPVENPAKTERKYNPEVAEALGITFGEEYTPLEIG